MNESVGSVVAVLIRVGAENKSVIFFDRRPKVITIDILHEKRTDVLQVASRHGVTSLRVFGSVARGEDSPDSDIDFLVTTGPQVSAWFPAGLILELEQLLGRHIDVVTESGLNPQLKEQVIAEAVEF